MAFINYTTLWENDFDKITFLKKDKVQDMNVNQSMKYMIMIETMKK